jgi:phosphonate transport system substrate-binding protein
MTRKHVVLAVLLTLVAGLVILPGCGKKNAASKAQTSNSTTASDELGTADNPIKIAVVPSIEAQKLILSGKQMEKMLEKETGYKYKVTVPASYAAVVEGIGGETVDVAWLPPLPYVLAHEKYGSEVILVTERAGAIVYQSFIIARTDSGIKSLEDLKGKKFAFGDPLSTSGTLYPKLMLKKQGITDPDKYFSKVLYAGSHDKVATAVYNGNVDAGAIYGGVDSDAREQLAGSIKDIYQKTTVIAKSDDIPNDTVTVRKGLPKDMVDKLEAALIKMSKSQEGRKLIFDMYGIDSLKPTTDAAYDSVREAVKASGLDIEKAVKEN